jgi:hypothetical protein
MVSSITKLILIGAGLALALGTGYIEENNEQLFDFETIT